MKSPFSLGFRLRRIPFLETHHRQPAGGIRSGSLQFNRFAGIGGVLFATVLFAWSNAQANAAEVSLDNILSVIRAGKIELQFCNEKVLSVDACNTLANAIATRGASSLAPTEIAETRQEPKFQTLGSDCPQRGVSIAGLPLTLYDLEVHRKRTTAFGPFRVFRLSQQYPAWEGYSLVLASGFADQQEDYSAGHSYSWVLPYLIPADTPCDGREIGALFVGDTGQPSNSVRHAEVVEWEGDVFLLSFQSELGLGLPVYVTVYEINSEPSRYIANREVLAPTLAFIAKQ